MHYSVFLLYLTVLVALPLLALRRWGLLGALIVTVLQLAFVAASYYVIATNKLFPVQIEPVSDHPFAISRARQAAGYVELMIWGFTPAVAALAGGALSVVWSVARLLWRASRQPQA